jgi:hypothetical protein
MKFADFLIFKPVAAFVLRKIRHGICGSVHLGHAQLAYRKASQYAGKNTVHTVDCGAIG